MADAAVKAGVASPPSQEDDVGNPGGMKMLSSPVCVNLMGRTERALRMALGGALIMALTMCDIPHMDYSFKYIGPFLFFVIGTLAPPFVSSAGVVLFAALFCILLACASVTLLLACLLLDSGGQALCICVYALLVVWSSCLSVSKTKDMTLIGSYILLYILPLATLMCAEFVRSGISVEVTPERYLALQQFLKNSTVAEIKEKASHFFLLRPSTVDAIVDSIGSSQAIMLALKAILAKLKIPDLPLSGGALDLEKILQLISLVTQKLPAGMPLSVDLKVSRDWGLDLPQGWMYDMPLFIEGVVGERVVIGARPGAWFIKTLWVASGPMGILRNLIIFAFLGFAVYLLVMLVPPIRRQRDVAVREMAAACFVIRGSLKVFRQELERMETQGAAFGGLEVTARGEGPADNGQTSAPSDSKAETSCAAAVDALDRAVRRLIDAEKAVLLSGMEPFLLYPGPGVWTMKELDAVRRNLIHCCIQTQRMAQLLRNAKAAATPTGGSARQFLAAAATALLDKSEEMYELCEQLLTTFPCVFSPQRFKQRMRELSQKMAALEQEMRTLGLKVFHPVEVNTEEALLELDTETAAVGDGEQQGEANEPEKKKADAGDSLLQRTVDLLPQGLATTAFVHAGYSSPVLLGRAISDLAAAQQTNGKRGLLLNIAFLFVSLLVHLRRLFITPFVALTSWRLSWRGPKAWWRNPECWYAVKLVVPLICIFACGICLPKFRKYSWGINLTERPNLLDFSEAGVTTRMVPWFMLGYLTVLQTTYNGTVHRAICRTLGILLGSFSGWVGLKLCGSSVAGLIAFCAVTVFLDIFFFADSEHPLDGFHKTWGYAGVVFTYTQSLVVTLSTEDNGGLTGDMNYVVVTRILSNLMGILLGVVVTHVPPLASATTSACKEYTHVMQCCTTGFTDMTQSFLCICGGGKEEYCATFDNEDKPSADSLPVQREQAKVSAVSKMLDSTCKEHLQAAARYIREGQNLPLLLPWRTSSRLAKVHVAMMSMMLETLDAAQLMLDILNDDEEDSAGQRQSNLSPQEVLSFHDLESFSPDDAAKGDHALARRLSMPLMQRDNCAAVRQVFQTAKGGQLREALRCMCDAISTLAAAADAEICASLPAFGERLMNCGAGYAQQGDSPKDHQQAFESCRAAADRNASEIKVALAECLCQHRGLHAEARAARMASAFVVMRLLYHLQSVTFSLDEVHAALTGEADGGSPACPQSVALRNLCEGK